MSTGNTPPEQPYDPNQPRIADPCPSCGGSTLFIGAGGWLTCSLIGCRQPVMFDAIAAVRLPLERRVAQLEAALRECVSDLIWCSGSNDFGDGGQARIGWLKGPAQSIERAHTALAGAPEREEK